jgi:hypothetical protein
MNAFLTEVLTKKSPRKKSNLKKAALSSTADTLVWTVA